MSRERFFQELDVSRETQARFDAYAALLVKWQASVNLVGPETLPDIWTRHFLDSGQLMRFLPPSAQTLVDFGSGAGFPGLVLAILGAPEVHLVESDQRKAAFLREAARVTETPVQIHAVRAGALKPFVADVVTARALAPLDKLLDLAAPFMGPATTGLFLKGRTAQEELTAARKGWKMETVLHPSLTASDSVVLDLHKMERVPQ